MPAPRRLTPEQIGFVKSIAGKRRALMAELRGLPSAEELATELHVSPRTIERVSNDGYAVSSTGNKPDRVSEALAELQP